MCVAKKIDLVNEMKILYTTNIWSRVIDFRKKDYNKDYKTILILE